MVVEKGERVNLTPGQRLFQEGEVGDRAYVLEVGQLEISKKVGSEEVVLATIGRGAIVGEMALIDAAPRMATARATQACTLLVVTRESFQKKLESMDPVTRHLLKRFVNIIREQGAELARRAKGR